MGKAKSIILKPISRADAAKCIKAHHYSGKSVQNSQVHIGVFLHGTLEGALQFGPCMDKRRMMGLVRDTKWDGFLELNRMAFGPMLPKNSESRALAISMRLLKKHRPTLEWVVSFADGTQCGDGTIYRASGFLLTAIKKNSTLLRMPDGKIVADKTLNDHICAGGRRGTSVAKEMGATPLSGFQLRYLYPLNDTVRGRLTVPVLPFSAIDEAGARMYKGERPSK